MTFHYAENHAAVLAKMSLYFRSALFSSDSLWLSHYTVTSVIGRELVKP